MSNLKAALCPSCGGKLQLPDNLKTVICMYCGVMVTVQDAFRLSTRVRDYTEAQMIEKVREHKPFDIEAAKKLTVRIVVGVGLSGLIFSLCLVGSDSTFAAFMAATFLAFMPIIYLIRSSNLKKIIAADQEMAKKGAMVSLIGYRGQCPYCDTSIVLNGNVKGDNCPACAKRIVVRESKFYSVDTPVANVN